MQAVLPVIAVLAIWTPGCKPFQWSEDFQDGARVDACENSSATFPWNVTLDVGEDIVDIQWFYEGLSEELIAMYAQGHFIPMAPYSGRAQQLPLAGLAVSHVVEKDSGNYSVAVTAQKTSGSATIYRRGAELLVHTENSAILDVTVDVIQQPRAVYDAQTDEYHVQLTCAGKGQPPSTVIWTTPSGSNVSTSNRQGDEFSLLLPNPVSGGNYTCHAGPDSPAARCLPKDYDTPLGGSTVFVDRTEARVTVLEAENMHLKIQNDNLTHRLDLLETSANRHVSFYAYLMNVRHLQNRDAIVPMTAVSNQGNAYDPSTGVFKAPYSGVYCFHATSGTYPVGHKSNMELMLEGRMVARAYSYGASDTELGSLQAVLHLAAGDRVVLQSEGEGYFDDYSTSFSGFLINAD